MAGKTAQAQLLMEGVNAHAEEDDGCCGRLGTYNHI